MAAASQPALLSGFSDSAEFQYIENFVDLAEASRLLQTLYTELRWEQQEIRLFGRKIPQPRLSCWYGDADAEYAYSGLRLAPLPWHPELSRLRRVLQGTLQHPFNSVLANAYRNGRDSMGWHADDEKELGTEPLIASLSLGACRRFLLRARRGNQTMGLALQHGSLLLMRGTSQLHYRHSLPKTSKSVGLRINLTFRQIKSR